MIKLENFDMDEIVYLMEHNPSDPRWQSVSLIKQMGEMPLIEVFTGPMFGSMREIMSGWKKIMKPEERKKVPPIEYDLKYCELCQFLFQRISQLRNGGLTIKKWQCEWSYIYKMTLFCGKAFQSILEDSNIYSKDYYLAINYLYRLVHPDKDMIPMDYINDISENNILRRELSRRVRALTDILVFGDIFIDKQGMGGQQVLEDMCIVSAYVYAIQYEAEKAEGEEDENI